MTFFVRFDELPIGGKTGKDSVCHGRGDSAQFPHIGVHDICVRLQEVFDLLPAHGCLIHRPITHFISRVGCVYERCFDVCQHKFDERSGFFCIVTGAEAS